MLNFEGKILNSPSTHRHMLRYTIIQPDIVVAWLEYRLINLDGLDQQDHSICADRGSLNCQVKVSFQRFTQILGCKHNPIHIEECLCVVVSAIGILFSVRTIYNDISVEDSELEDQCIYMICLGLKLVIVNILLQ